MIAGRTNEARLFRWILPLLLAGVFLAYVRYSQRYIGAVDWYGYYAEGELMKSGTIYLPTDLPPDKFPSGVPLGFVTVGNHALPTYPPGFPLLLALGGLVGIPLLVTPITGLLSCILMYQVMRDLSDRWTAAALTMVWAFFPTTVFGGTNIMSDGVATTAVLASYLCYRRGWIAASAWVLGFAFAVRPTNVIYFLPFLILLVRDKKLIRYGLHLVVPVALYGFYNATLYGEPWRTGYADISTDLDPAVFRDHLKFYLNQVLWQATPILIVLALLGLRPWRSEKLFYVLWFTPFVLFYSFWRSGGDRWWWTRFIGPGTPPLFFLAACGWTGFRGWLAARLAPRFNWAPHAVLAALTIALVTYDIEFGLWQKDLWIKQKGHDYHDVVMKVSELAPAGSVVGSVEFAGSLKLYTSLIPFVSTHDNGPEFVAEAFKNGRRVFLAVEPWNAHNPNIASLLAKYQARETVRLLPTWGGVPIYELTAPP